MFNKLFRPKIDHADAAVRLLAIKKLNGQKNASSLLGLALDDPDQSVRLAAIAQLDDFDALNTLLSKQNDEMEMTASQARIGQLIKSNKSVSQKQAAALFNRINDTQLKGQLVSKITDSNILAALVETTRSQDALAQLAVSASSTEARKKAASKIFNVGALKIVQHKSNDKSVQHVVRQAHHKIKAQQKKETLTHESLIQICQALERLSKHDYDSIYTSRLQVLTSHWEGIDEQYKLNYMHRYSQALNLCQNIIMQYKQAVALEALQQSQNELCLGLCNSMADLIKHTDLSNLDQWSASHTQWQQQWHNSIKNFTPDVETNAYYLKLVDAANLLSTVVGFYQQKQLDKVVEPYQSQRSADPLRLRRSEDDLFQLKQKIIWPYTFPQPALFEQLSVVFRDIEVHLNAKRKKSNQQKKEISKKTGLLRSAVRQKNLIKANRLHNYIQNQIQQLPESEHEHQIQLLSPVLVDLENLRGLHRFATWPKKQALCKQMQDLIGFDIPPQQLMIKIKLLQDKWKSLSASDSQADDLLWDEFKQAADKAFEPCADYLEVLEKIKHKNLDLRRQLVQQLTAYTEEIAWDKVHWKQVQTDFNQFTKKFRALSPIFFADNKPVEKEFEDLMAVIKEKLNAEKDENHAIYASLIERAKALTELEPDQTEQAIEKIKLLQAQWKNVGLTFYNKANQQWQEFKGICDQLFTRQRELQQCERDEHKLQTDRLYKIINQIHDLSMTDDAQLLDTQAQYQELIEAYKKLQEKQPVHDEKLTRSFKRRCDEYEEHLSGHSKRTQAQTHDSIRRAAALCVELECLSLAGSDFNKFDELTQLYAQFTSLPEPIKSSFDQRIDLAAKLLQGNDPLVESLKANASRLVKLAIELEVLFDIESPDEDKTQRMQYQLIQLQSGIKPQLDKKHKLQKLITAELMWYQVGMVEVKKRHQLEKRLAVVISRSST